MSRWQIFSQKYDQLFENRHFNRLYRRDYKSERVLSLYVTVVTRFDTIKTISRSKTRTSTWFNRANVLFRVKGKHFLLTHLLPPLSRLKQCIHWFLRPCGALSLSLSLCPSSDPRSRHPVSCRSPVTFVPSCNRLWYRSLYCQCKEIWKVSCDVHLENRTFIALDSAKQGNRMKTRIVYENRTRTCIVYENRMELWPLLEEFLHYFVVELLLLRHTLLLILKKLLIWMNLLNQFLFLSFQFKRDSRWNSSLEKSKLWSTISN